MKDFLKRVVILLSIILLFPIIGLMLVFDAVMMILYYLYKGKFLWDAYTPLVVVFLELVYGGKSEWKKK